MSALLVGCAGPRAAAAPAPSPAAPAVPGEAEQLLREDADTCHLRADLLAVDLEDARGEQARAWEAATAAARTCRDQLGAAQARGRADVAAAEQPAPGAPWWAVAGALVVGAAAGAAAVAW